MATTTPIPDGSTNKAWSPPTMAPHLHPAGVVAEAMDVDPARGLSQAEAERRRAVVGDNQLTSPARRPAWLRFTDQFRSVLILILLTAGLVAGLIGDLKDAAVILVVLVVNAMIGFVQENRAERSLDALRELLEPTARVRREGEVRVLEAAHLVPGDLVLLEAGDKVPADGRLLLSESLEVDESALTGESQPVVKTTAATAGAQPSADVVAQDVPLAEQTCMVFSGTALTRGRAELVVTSTGMDSQVGAIAGLLATGRQPKTPLQVQLDSVGKRIALIGGIAIVAYAVLALLQGQDSGDIALSAVALAVATVPEGLPAVVALTLALGVGRMAGRGAIVKRLASVETLGSATVVCSDKTGTLTMNQMTARSLVLPGRRHVLIEGEGYLPRGALREPDGSDATGLGSLLIPLALCNDATLTGAPSTDASPGGGAARGPAAGDADNPEDGPGAGNGPGPGSGPGASIVGDPTEGALVVAAAKAGIDVPALRAATPRTAELPFDSTLRLMATAHQEPDPDGGPARTRLYVKGAPDVLLARSITTACPDGVRSLDQAGRDELEAEVTALASSGLRVLAAATRLLPSPPGDRAARQGDLDLAPFVTGLTFLGLVGLADPPRPQAHDAVARARRAGVDVKMITGDHRDTAAAISRELGITGDVVTGADLDRMSENQLEERIEGIGVFARVAPEHKVAIVRALSGRGHVVAMTGDGVNDAAALRAAHMGVAMGLTGTAVTKEAADMILTDDNFSTVISAVNEGRAIYDNIVKFVRFQLTTNIGAILSFLGATALGMPAPLSAIQVLWVNIIMDGPPAMALGVDPARPGLMTEPPRPPEQRILDRRRLMVLLRGGIVMATGTLAVLAVGRDRTSEPVALTMAFTTFVLFQLFNALNARDERRTIFTAHLFTNRWLWGTLGMVALLQVLAVQLPLLHPLFDTTALGAGQWLICAAVASTILIVEEAIKLLRGRR